MTADQPRTFVITLPRAPERWAKEAEHLSSVGITFEKFRGVDGRLSGLVTTHLYEVDNPGYKMGAVTVNLFLSHFMLWRVLEYLPDDAFWILEDDSQWDQKWKEQYIEAVSVLPEDWDLVWLGSCNCTDKGRHHIGKNLFSLHWPQCTHAYMVRKKALPVLIESHQKVWAPLDIAMTIESMPRLKTYTILPRLCAQFDTMIVP